MSDIRPGPFDREGYRKWLKKCLGSGPMGLRDYDLVTYRQMSEPPPAQPKRPVVAGRPITVWAAVLLTVAVVAIFIAFGFVVSR